MTLCGEGLPNDALAPTVFHESWWLEIASAGRFQVAEVSHGGKTVGRLPYLAVKRFGFTLLEMPLLTHFLGPGITPLEGSTNNVFLRRLAITRELIQKLPSASLTRIKMHHEIDEVIAFQEQGFRTSVQFTHEIYPKPENVLWANMRNKTRNVIRRAREQVRVLELADAAEFVAFQAGNLAARGVRSHLDWKLCTRLIAESLKRGRGRILAAYDITKVLVAANFYIWDRTSYYFLLSTRHANSGNGVTSLLLWEGIKDASQRGLIFDSDGLNSRGGILFLAGLGASIKPRFIATRMNPTGALVETFRKAVWGENYFVRG